MEWGGVHKSSQVLPCWQALATELNIPLLLCASVSTHSPCKCDHVIMWLQLVSVSETMPRRYLPAMHRVRSKDKTDSPLHDAQIHWFWNKTLGLNRIWDSYVPWRTAAPPPWLPLHLLELNNKPSTASRVLRAQRPPRIARKQSFTSLFPQSLYLLESLTYENTNIDAHTKDQLIRKIIKNHKKKKITLELLLQPKSQGEF